MDSFPSLTLQDPLEAHEVIISLRVKPNTGANRNKRAVLVSVGVEGQIPLITETEYDQIETVTNRLWIKAANQLNLDGSDQPSAESSSDSSSEPGEGGADKTETEAEAEELFVDEDDLF